MWCAWVPACDNLRQVVKDLPLKLRLCGNAVFRCISLLVLMFLGWCKGDLKVCMTWMWWPCAVSGWDGVLCCGCELWVIGGVLWVWTVGYWWCAVGVNCALLVVWTVGNECAVMCCRLRTWYTSSHLVSSRYRTCHMWAPTWCTAATSSDTCWLSSPPADLWPTYWPHYTLMLDLLTFAALTRHWHRTVWWSRLSVVSVSIFSLSFCDSSDEQTGTWTVK